MEESKFPELALELNDEGKPKVIDVASSSADKMRDETNQKVTQTEKSSIKGKVQNPDFEKIPPNAQNEAIRAKQPTRVLQRRRIPTKCC